MPRTEEAAADQSAHKGAKKLRTGEHTQHRTTLAAVGQNRQAGRQAGFEKIESRKEQGKRHKYGKHAKCDKGQQHQTQQNENQGQSDRRFFALPLIAKNQWHRSEQR